MIRKAEYKDLTAVTNLWESFMEGEIYIDFIVDDKAKAEWMEYALKHLKEEGHGILVNDDGEINAFLMYEPRKNIFRSPVRKGYISDLYVKPEMRKQGIGRALMNEAVKIMKEYFDKIQLQVYSGNENAIKLYRSMGFKDFSLIMEYQ